MRRVHVLPMALLLACGESFVHTPAGAGGATSSVATSASGNGGASASATTSSAATSSATASSGSGATGPWISCQQLRDEQPEARSGVYDIDLDGTGDAEPLPVYCSMEADGAWTLVMNQVPTQ